MAPQNGEVSNAQVSAPVTTSSVRQDPRPPASRDEITSTSTQPGPRDSHERGLARTDKPSVTPIVGPEPRPSYSLPAPPSRPRVPLGPTRRRSCPPHHSNF